MKKGDLVETPLGDGRIIEARADGWVHVRLRGWNGWNSEDHEWFKADEIETQQQGFK